MISYIFLAIGLVLLVEGLVYALAPSLVEQLLAALRSIPIDQRRVMGLFSMVLGAILLWCARVLGL